MEPKMSESHPPPQGGGDQTRADQMPSDLATVVDGAIASVPLCSGRYDPLGAEITANRISAARIWSKVRRIRETVLGPALFADPAWDMLLELYIERDSDRPYSISSLCAAGQTAPTTALRWIARLELEGRIVRDPDPTDRRRFYVRLAPRTVTELDKVMDGFIASKVDCMRNRLGHLGNAGVTSLPRA
jgi:DNA-binding MarR family transcriptional regulator